MAAAGPQFIPILEKQAALRGQASPKSSSVRQSNRWKILAAVKAQPLGIEMHPHQGRPGLPVGFEGQPHILKRSPQAHLVDAPGQDEPQQQRPQQQRPQVPPEEGGQGGQGPNQSRAARGNERLPRARAWTRSAGGQKYSPTSATPVTAQTSRLVLSNRLLKDSRPTPGEPGQAVSHQQRQG